MKISGYPIDSVLNPLSEFLTKSNVILSAPPGAGKSTQLPLHLLKCFPHKTIIMLQPRRVVVRNLAAYLAQQLNEGVGETIGYQIKGERRVSPNTRLIIVTEAVLTRKLQTDAELNGIDIIIFDEFHERNIHSDFSLALCVEVQQILRDDLRLIVMSATLDTLALESILPEAQHLVAQGRMFPVEISYVETVLSSEIAEACAQQALNCCRQYMGDVLVFLPTVSMLKRASNWLTTRVGKDAVAIHELYGQLDKDAQQLAIHPDTMGRQKIIVATNIAETSLTIENITTVIDSGLANVASFHLSTGLTELSLQRISKASATQRTGRAGRLTNGRCIRMWSHQQQQFLVAHAAPQILQEDITTITLAALIWGTPIQDMNLLTQPSPAQLQFAQQELTRLGALDHNGKVTEYAKRLEAFPCHPALAHLILSFADYVDEFTEARFTSEQIVVAACWAAAIMGEGLGRNTDITLSDALKNINRTTHNLVKQQAQQLAAKLDTTKLINLKLGDPKQIPIALLSVCIAFAQPRRLGYCVKPHTVKLLGGRQARIEQNVAVGTWVVIIDAVYKQQEVTISCYEVLSEETVFTYFSDNIETTEQVSINPQHKRIQAKQKRKLGAITLSEKPIERPNGQACIAAWKLYLRKLDSAEWPFSASDHHWWRRVQLAFTHLAHAEEEVASLTIDKLSKNQSRTGQQSYVHFLNLLPPQHDAVLAVHRWQQIEEVSWSKLIHNHLPWPVQQYMQQHLPLQITLDNGFIAPLTYRQDGSVVLSARLQKLFGCYQQITVGKGKIPVLIELLSPANRPLQTTHDLAGFWHGSYQPIRKEMRGRYPKHNWDPPG